MKKLIIMIIAFNLFVSYSYAQKRENRKHQEIKQEKPIVTVVEPKQDNVVQETVEPVSTIPLPEPVTKRPLFEEQKKSLGAKKQTVWDKIKEHKKEISAASATLAAVATFLLGQKAYKSYKSKQAEQWLREVEKYKPVDVTTITPQEMEQFIIDY